MKSRSLVYLLLGSILLGICEQRSHADEKPTARKAYEGPLRLQLKSTPTSYAPDKFETTLTLTNRSDKPLMINQSMEAALILNLRDAEGKPIGSTSGRNIDPAFTTSMFGSLPSGQSSTKTINWLEYFPPLALEPGLIRVQFLYSTLSVYDYVKENGIRLWKGWVSSNAIAVRVGKDKIEILGDWLMVKPEIPLPGLKPGYKLLKAYPEGDLEPKEPRLYLVEERTGTRRLITGPKDLEGCVEITKEEEALAFVRLFTSLETQSLFPKGSVVELFGKNEKPYDHYGTVDHRGWDKLNLREALVTPEKEGFTIERNLIEYPLQYGGKAIVYRSSERVTATGAYRSQVKKILWQGVLGGNPRILLPYY